MKGEWEGDRGERRLPLRWWLVTSSFFSSFPLPFDHPPLSTNKIYFFRLPHGTVRGRDRSFRNSLEFGAGEHAGEDEIDAEELDDLENHDITEEETKRADVDAASCNPKLPKAHGHMGRLEPAEPNRKFCSVPCPSSRTFGWIFAKMRHFVSHLSPGRGPFPSKFPVCKTSLLQSMRSVGKMCLDLAIGVLRALFEKAPVRQGRFGAKFAKRQLFFDTQIFLFRIQKVIFGIHTAVRQGFNVGFCQSKCSVVFSFGVFSSTFQVGPIDHCQRPVKHTNCLPVTFTRAKLVRPWKSPCRKSMGLVSSQCKELFWYKPWSREIPDCLHEIYHVIAPALSHSDHRLHADQRCKRIHNAHKFEQPSRDCC